MNSRILLFLPLLFIFSALGRTQWVRTNGPNGGPVNALATIDTNLLAAIPDGTMLSSDNGATWIRVAGGLTDAFAVSGTDLFSTSNASRILLSTNNGEHWTVVANDLPNTEAYSLAMIDTALFIGTYLDGIFLSTNKGANWIAVDSGLSAPSVVNSFAVSNTNIFAAIDTGSFLDSSCIFLSTNLGKSWRAVNSGMAGVHVNTLIANGQNIFAGTDKGVFLSRDNGTSWIVMNMGLTDSNIYTLATNGSYLFAGTYDSGVFLSSNNGKSWIAMNDGLADTHVLTFASSSENLFAGTVGGFVFRRPFLDFARLSAKEILSSSISVITYPNPFSQTTTINFSSPENGPTKIVIINLLGQQVAQLFNGELDAGEHSFMWDAKGMPAGTYFCNTRMNGNVQRMPIVLAR